MKKKTLFIALGILLLLAASGITALYTCILNRPLRIDKPTYIYIDTDDNIDSVYYKLENHLLASGTTGFRMLVSYSHYAENIHTGAYRFSPKERTWDIFRRLQAGNQTPVKLTIPSVRTIGRLCKAVSRQIMADSADIARLLNDSAYRASLGYTAYTLPALFIPNTYEVYWNTPVDKFLDKMDAESKKFWNFERKQKAEAMGFTEEEVITLASIVDEETANDAEKPMVAGMYYNRLKANMPLQADPTIKFAMKDFDIRRIYHNMLSVNSPYNTYKNTGLPPGPIRIPTVAGIDAVLNHVHHNYLYMCAKEDFSGTHNFAETYSEHLENAAKYSEALNKRGIK